jgi:hypothetical protein
MKLIKPIKIKSPRCSNKNGVMIIVACLVSTALFNPGGGQMTFAGIQGAMTVLNKPAVISNKTAAPIMSSKTTSQSQELINSARQSYNTCWPVSCPTNR